MKSLLLFILITPFSFNVSGQSNEFSIHLLSGLFSFGGASSVSTTVINISDVPDMKSYINNPYGRSSVFSYGIAIQEQRITKSNFIFGLKACYESLTSHVKINYAFYGFGEIAWTVSDGNGYLTYRFINFQPFFGKRIKIINGVATDITIGIDMGVCLKSEENASVSTSQGDKISISSQPSNPDLDIRPRIELTNYYKKFGISFGYSYGLTNYTSRMDGANMEVFSRMIRIGLGYRF